MFVRRRARRELGSLRRRADHFRSDRIGRCLVVAVIDLPPRRWCRRRCLDRDRIGQYGVRQWMSATRPRRFQSDDWASGTRTSSVPARGCGRMSHRSDPNPVDVRYTHELAHRVAVVGPVGEGARQAQARGVMDAHRAGAREPGVVPVPERRVRASTRARLSSGADPGARRSARSRPPSYPPSRRAGGRPPPGRGCERTRRGGGPLSYAALGSSNPRASRTPVIANTRWTRSGPGMTRNASPRRAADVAQRRRR
jgi:hypothetical protein